MVNVILFENISASLSVCFVIVGVSGNSLMFLVYYCQSNLRKLSVSAYFRAIALVNILVNLFAINTILIYKANVFLPLLSQSACKAFYFLIIWSGAVTAWLEVVASIDRLLTIVYPNRFRLIQKSSFSFLIISLVLVYNVGIYFKIIIEYQFNVFDNPEWNSCTCSKAEKKNIDTIDFFNSTVVPFLFMLVSSSATLAGIIRSRRRLRSLSSRLDMATRRRQFRDTKFGATLIILNIEFFALNAPRRFFYFLQLWSLFKFDNISPFILHTSLVFLYDLHYAGCFYIQVLVNSLIRRELIRMFSRGRAKLRRLACIR